MNDLHSRASGYLPRWLEPFLAGAAAAHRVVVLTGPRQVGKSTLLRQAAAFQGWRYVTLDEPAALALAARAPEDLWAGGPRLVLDEVQKAPALLPAIKRVVDEDPRRRFVLSGSANLLLMQHVSESLAGRAVHFTLAPMTLGETRKAAPPKMLERLLKGVWPEERERPVRPPDPWPLIIRGFMPPLLRLSSPRAVIQWWEGYVATYLERDLRQISQVSSLEDYRRVMVSLALRTGQILNQTTVARDSQVPQPTVHRYLNLLETSCLLVRLPAFARNRGKRLIKGPKVFWADVGLAASLAGFHDAAALRASREAGGFLEALVCQHLQALAQVMTPRPRLYHWRTATGDEVDFVVEQGRALLALEVKATDRPGQGDAEGLRRFLDSHPEAVGGVVLHTGRDVIRLGQKLVALPWAMLAS